MEELPHEDKLLLVDDGDDLESTVDELSTDSEDEEEEAVIQDSL